MAASHGEGFLCIDAFSTYTKQESRQVKNAHARAKKYGLPCNLQAGHWREIKGQFEYKCAYCGESKPLTVEHLYPLSASRLVDYSFVAVAEEGNILPACKECNFVMNDLVDKISLDPIPRIEVLLQRGFNVSPKVMERVRDLGGLR